MLRYLLCRNAIGDELARHGRANSADVKGIRTGEWKYLQWKDRKAGDTRPVPRLFNLADDIGETTYLIDRYWGKAEQLKQQMKAFDTSIAP